MLLQTNSYIVPREKRAEHARIIRRFRQTLLRLGCEHFEVYEQVGSNWSNSESTGRYVQILRFVDRKHQLSVQSAERADPTAQAVISEFCDLINFPYQQQQGLFAVGFYTSVLPVANKREPRGDLVTTVDHYAVPEDGPGADNKADADDDAPIPITEHLASVADEGELDLSSFASDDDESESGVAGFINAEKVEHPDHDHAEHEQPDDSSAKR